MGLEKGLWGFEDIFKVFLDKNNYWVNPSNHIKEWNEKGLLFNIKKIKKNNWKGKNKGKIQSKALIR